MKGLPSKKTLFSAEQDRMEEVIRKGKTPRMVHTPGGNKV